MTTENFKKAGEIFQNAIEIENAEDRKRYLDNACEANQKLRADVEGLINAHEQANSFLNVASIDPGATLDDSPGFDGPGTKIGRYELLEQIGEGGMGLVYMAQQKKPVKRVVALKIIKPGMDSKQVIARFEAERQALAVLDHPNIARVFDAGTTKTGRPYFIMEYVKGMSITRYCDEKKLSIEKRLRLFENVCEGIHHAHQKGIIHRDLKPSNILVSVHGDRAVPKIIDFGIAKAVTQPLTEKTFVTFQGQLLGTPEYMSPEQVDMATQDIDTRSDIYSLGVVLYELLAGVLPFERESFANLGFAEVQRTIREQEPDSPSTRLTGLGEKAKTIAASRDTHVVALARRLHRELEWIPLKAMRKDRCRRYRSASELADDVRHYLDGLPLIAGPETAMYRMQKFARKHAGSVATVALVAVAVVLGLIVSTAMYMRSEKALEREAVARVQAEDAQNNETAARTRAEQAEKVAQEQRKLAEEQAEANRQALYFNRIAHAKAISEYVSPAAIRKILKSCSEDLRGWEWHHLWHISDQAILTMKGHDGHIYDIEWSPSGQHFASAGGDDGAARIWDAQTGTEILAFRGHEGDTSEVAFSPDGKLLATVGGSDKLVMVYEIPSGIEVFKLKGHDNSTHCVAFAPSGKQLASGDAGGVIKVWDTSTGANKATLRDPKGFVGSIAFRPGTDQVVSASGKEVKVWDVATQAELMTLEGHTVGIRSVAVTPDGKRIVSAGPDSMIKVWDALNGKELMTLRGHTATIHTVSISPDGTRLVSAGVNDNMIKVWDLDSGQELLTYRCRNWPDCAAFSPDGGQIVSGDSSGEIKVRDVTMYPLGTMLEGHRAYVHWLVFSPDGNSIVSCGADSAVKLWDVASGVEKSTWGKFMSRSFSVAFHPNGEEIALGKGDGRIVIWDTATKKVVRTISGHEDKITCISFNSDGRRLASGSSDKTVKVWNSTKGNCELTFHGHEKEVLAISFSPNDKHIVSGGSDNAVRMWDATDGSEIKVFEGHDWAVDSVTYTADGQRIISGSAYGPARVWDVQNGVELVVLGGHDLWAGAMQVSPDGERIAYVNRTDNTVVVLDTATGMQALAIPVSGGRLSPLVFSPDGKTIALGSDKSILLLESEVPVKGYKVRRDARKARELIDRLHADHQSYLKIADLLRADTTHDKDICEKALQTSLSRQWDDLRRELKESLETTRIAGKDIAIYQRAMQQAQRANNSQPDNALGLFALGMAQYRVGAYEEARTSLLSAREIWISFQQDASPLTLAFVPMVQYQLGQIEEGRSEMNTLRYELHDMSLRNLMPDKLLESHRIEAEKVFAGTNERLLAIWELIDTKELDRAVEMFTELQPSSEGPDSEFTFSLEGMSKYLSRACYARGKSRLVDTDQGYINRASDYEAAIRIDPNYVSVLKDLAWLRATCTVEEVRDPARAVEEASLSCELTNWKNHECLSVLACAYSESERFTDAVKRQQEAIGSLSGEDQAKWRGNYAERLRIYQSDMPYSAGERWSFSHGKIIALWDFNDGEDGVVNNFLVDGPDGKLVDGAEIVADTERGNVLGLHGEGRMECLQDAAFDISGAISVGAWVKLRSLTKDMQMIIFKGLRCWTLSAASEGNSITMRIYIEKNEEYLQGLNNFPLYRTGIHGDVDLTDERWHHVAATYDGKKVCLYIDGRLRNFTRIRGNIATDDSIIVVGDNPEWSGDSWNGLIDDVRICSYAWSAEEVKDLYEGREPPREK